MQGNKVGKTKGNSGKENHQGRETKGEETKAPLHLHKAITLIRAMTDQIKAVEEVAEVTHAGGQTEETLSTHKLQ